MFVPWHRWDPEVGFTLNAGRLQALNDQIGACHLENLVPSRQCLYQANNPNLNNRASFDGDLVDDYIGRTGAGSDFATIRALHDGTEVTLAISAFLIPGNQISETLIATTNISVSGYGIWLGLSALNGGGHLWLFVSRGASPEAISVRIPCSPGRCLLTVEMGSARVPNWEVFRDQISIGSGNYAAAPQGVGSTNLTFHDLVSPARPGKSQGGLYEIYPGNSSEQRAYILQQHRDRFGYNADALTDWNAVTFSRAAVATFWDKDNINGAGPFMYKYGSNVPRILADGSILIERAHTNQLWYHNQIANPPWGVVGTPVVQNNSGTAPDGSNTATRIQMDPNESVRQGYSPGTGPNIFGTWLKENGITVSQLLLGWSSPQLLARGFTIDSSWQRYTLPWLNGNGATFISAFETFDRTAVGGIAAHSEDLLAFGAQAQLQTYLSELIQTAGAPATQPKDTAYVALPVEMTSGVWEVDVWPEFSSAEYIADSTLPATAMIFRSNGATYNWLAFAKGATAGVQCYYGTASSIASLGLLWVSGDKITIRSDQNNFALDVFVNDVFQGHGVASAGPPQPWTWTSIARLYLHDTNNAAQSALRISQARRPATPDPNVLMDYSKGTLTRACVATWFDSVANRLYTFSANVPRILADGSIIIEGARTNISLRSNELDQSPWSSSGSVTVTPNVATGPDGQPTADRLQIASGARRTQQSTLTGDYVLSAILKTYQTDLDWQLSFGGAGGAAARGSIGGLATDWTRYVLPAVTVAGAVDWNLDGRDLTGIGGVVAHTEDLLASNIQLEQGWFSSQPIETGATSATRLDEFHKMLQADIDPRLYTEEWEFDWTPFWPSSGLAAGWTIFQEATGAGGIRWDGSQIALRTDLTLDPDLTSNPLTFSAYQTIHVVLNLRTGSMTVSGATTGNGTTSLGTPQPLPAGDYWIGSRGASSRIVWSKISQPRFVS